MTVQRVSAENWPVISALLDEALDLPAAQRGAWLDTLPPERQALRATLELLLARAEATAGAIAPGFAQAVVAAAAGWQPGARVGPYTLRRQIGRGGMGSVWEAERDDSVLQRTVALKLPHTWLDDPGLVERLARERNILARLAHPHIARLYDAGITPEGHPFMAMELIDGEPITAHCDQRRLPLRERLALFIQVLDAVQYAHERLVIHRDIKPGNILVTPAGQAMLLDFGIAKLLDDGLAAETELTRQAGRMLTPEYASPEQITGQTLTTASDVYSLGRVLYELLVGRRPFDLAHESAGALEQAIVGSEPIAPSAAQVDEATAAQRGLSGKRLSAELRGDLDTIVGRALKADPAQRYATASALRDDLQRHLRGEPVLAQPDSRWYRTRKFAARHRVGIGAATAVFVALAIGLGTALWQASVARQEAARSALEARKASSIKDFLVQVFDANDPNGETPKNPSQYTAVEILDSGARRIEGAFLDEPPLRLELLLTLAGLYDEIGVPGRAVHLCELAVKTAGAEPALATAGAARAASAPAVPAAEAGTPSPGQADAWRCLGMALEGSDKNAALRALEQSEAVMKALGDHDSLVYAQVRTLKAGMLREHGPGQLEQARDMLHDVMPVWQHYPSHQGHVYAWTFLAGMEWDLGNKPAALQAADRAIAVATAADQAVALGEARRERAGYAMKMGDLGRAQAEFEGALKAIEPRLGARHWRTLWSRCDLGRALVLNGQREAGIAMLESATETMEQVFPASDPLSVCYERLAFGQLASGRTDLAERPFSLAAPILRQLDSRQQLSMARLGLVQVQDFLGRTAAAREALQAVARDSPGGAAPPRARLRLAEIDLHEQRLDAAASGLDALIADGVGAAGDQMQAKALRAELALRQGDPADATRRANQTLDELAARGLRWLPGVEPGLQLVLGEARCTQDPGEDAARPMRAAVQTLQQLQHPDSPALAAARARLGLCLWRRGQRDEAAQLARQADAALRAHAALNADFRRPLQALQSKLATAPKP